MTLNGLIAANNLSDVVDIERTWDNIGSNIFATISVPSPTLDLNFAGNKSLVDEISGNNLITFSRASTGTFVGSNGVIQTAASGVPRFDHNPATGESLGLLVEEARTNVQLNSEQFNLWFTNGSSTITANAGTSPSGTTTADKITPTATLNAHYVCDTTTRGSGTFSFSVYAKASGYPRLGLRVYDGTAYQIRVTFDISAGTIVLLEAGTASITPVGNGWYRCSGTGTSASGNMGTVAGWVIESLPSTATVQQAYTGDGTSGALLWGAQVEVGAFPTSYIPTTTATVTRAADVASITGTNFSSWYNQSQGSLFGSFKTSTTDGNMGLFAAYQNSAPFTNRISLRPRASFADTAGAQQFVFFTTVPTSQQTKIAWGFGSTATLYKDGVSIGTDSSVSLSSALDSAGIGVIESLNGWINGTIARLTYYPVRLSNITLQALTTYGPVSSFPYSFSIKGRDILALKEVNKTSTRDFVSIKGLTSKVQPRINTASQYTASGVVLRNAAMPKVAPTTIGNYFFSSGLTLSGTTVQINGTNALSIATSPFGAATATVPLLFAGLRPQANWRFSEAMTSGTIASPELAIPIETSDFLLFIKTGQS